MLLQISAINEHAASIRPTASKPAASDSGESFFHPTSGHSSITFRRFGSNSRQHKALLMIVNPPGGVQRRHACKDSG
jgi:hypothetical protein